MNRQDFAKLDLPGGTVDRTNQLAFLSLSDGKNNTLVGLNAGNRFPASNNVFVGTSAGQNSELASTSVFIGTESGKDASRVQDVVAVGYQAGKSSRDSYSNVLLGSHAGQNLRRADFNTAVGHKAMGDMASGRRSVAIGAFSAATATATANGVYVGYEAGSRARGSENVCVGAGSGTTLAAFESTVVGFESGTVLAGDAVTAVGSRSLRNAENASRSVAIGAQCGIDADHVTDSVLSGFAAGGNSISLSNAVVIGAYAGGSLQGNNVTAIGAYSAANAVNTDFSVLIGSGSGSGAIGAHNVFVGAGSGGSASAANSTVLGFEAGATLDGNSIVAVGSTALRNLVGSDRCVGVGTGAGKDASDSVDSVMLGFEAGRDAVGAANSVLIGSGAGSGAIGAHNVFVGSGSGGTASAANSTVLGFEAGATLDGNSIVAVGSTALRNLVGSDRCVGVGTGAGKDASDSVDAVMLGFEAGRDAVGAANSVLIGSSAGASIASENVTALGARAMEMTTIAGQSVAIGAECLGRGENVTNSVVAGCRAGQDAAGLANTVIVGFSAARVLVDGSDITIVGASALETALQCDTSVVIGTNAARDANDIASTVIAGYEAGRYAENVETSVIIGSSAGAVQTRCSNNVVIGHSTARTMSDSVHNTIIGSECAGNTMSRYSTVVGSGSMNRRNGEMVEFANCVIVGENITFDLPLATNTLEIADAVLIDSNGVDFYDSTHLFADPFTVLVSSSGPGSGSVLYSMTESGTGLEPLTTAERRVTMFQSLQITPGTYHVDWYATTPGGYGGATSLYDVSVNVASNVTHHSISMAANVETITKATKTIVVANSHPAMTWMDLTVTQNPEPEGIQVEYSFLSLGTVITPSESPAVFAVSGLDATNGFTWYQYANSHPASSYLQLSAVSSTADAQKALYSTATYTIRTDSGVLVTTYVSGDTHAIRGSGTAANVDTPAGRLTLSNVATHTGFTAVDYDIATLMRRLEATCIFSVPQTQGTFGFEWLANTQTEDVSMIGDGYASFVTVDANTVSVATYASGAELFNLTSIDAYTFDRTVVQTSEALPIDVSGVRAYDDVRARLRATHNLSDTSSGIITNLQISGYNAGDFDLGLDPQDTLEYTFETFDTGLPIDSTDLGNVSVFAQSDTDSIIATDLTIGIGVNKEVPLFERCVFIGSNFTVQDDVRDVLIISLGPENVVHATPNIFTISSDQTRLNGHLVVGSSRSSNYLAFRGLYGDGYVEDIPTAYIGERVYIPDTEKSELLIAKGEDPTGYTGPDRVRVLSGEVRLDIFANIVSNSYVYTRRAFEDIAEANVLSRFVANYEGAYVGGNVFAPLVDNVTTCGNSAQRWTTVYAVNGTVQTSDAREKEWEPLPYGLDSIAQVEPVMYRWRSQRDLPEDHPEKHHTYYGVIAQQVNDIFPELVYDEKDPYTLNYSELIPPLINAVKELRAQVNDLQRKLSSSPR